MVAVVGHARPEALFINEKQVTLDAKHTQPEVLSKLPFRNDVYIRFTGIDGREKKGLLVQTAEGLTVFDMDGEILRTIEGVAMDSQRGDYVGSDKNGWFNVNTGEAMLVTMPDSGISVLE